jgi:hypothetical protein
MSNDVAKPTAMTRARTISPARATIVSRRWRLTPVAPAMPSSATATITKPAVITSPPASVNSDEIGVR